MIYGRRVKMQRGEAIFLLTRILSSCKPSDVTFISLNHQDPKTACDSDGYELHFKWAIDDHDFNIIKEIVSGNNLGFKQYEDGRLVI